MNRLLPRSLIGQIFMVMALALLLAQIVNFSLIFSERQRSSRMQAEGPAMSRFVSLAQRLSALPAPQRQPAIEILPSRSRFSLRATSLLSPSQSDPLLAERLRHAAAAGGLQFTEARAASLEPDRLARSEDRRRRYRALALSLRLQDGLWLNGEMLAPRPDPWIALRPAIAVLLTFIITLAAMIWMASRLARPLRDLTTAADRFRGHGEAPHVPPTGPEDLRRAILAFNAMGARVSAMLDEKDRMLGAIGHDLRTPLASLRIRAESVEPEEERRPMIETIEEMTAMLDDTLALARSGRAAEDVRPVDLSALADTVVEEFRAFGHQVEMENGARVTARVQPNLLRRAIRNLVDNGVKYAGAVEVAVRRESGELRIVVSDRGMGIPEADLGRVLEPFHRGEPSRNRETGGTGLGLTLARAAAQAHGGDLVLENRIGGGLVARIVLPIRN